jgi:hypothetical protein
METSNSVNVKEELLTKTQLKARGWTDKLIASLLGQPDQTRSNPYYRSGPEMQLYCLQRIEAAEALSEFQQGTADRAKRKEAARKAVVTKRAQIESYVESVEIIVPQFDKDELIKTACDHWNARQQDEGRFGEFASTSSDTSFLARIVVNLLRHHMTAYEEHLAMIAGRVGTDKAYLAIKEKVLKAIAHAYPWLADECLRQTRRMHESASGRQF